MGRFVATLIVAVIVFMATVALIKVLYPYLIVTTILLWSIILFSFLYANAKAPALITNSEKISAGFDWLLAVRSQQQDELVVPPKQRNPKQALKEALYFIDQRVYGQDRVKQQINAIFTKLENSPHKGLRALSTGDGCIILAKGPHGTGKSVVISQFISLLYGAGIIGSEKIIEVDKLDFPGGSDPLDIWHQLCDSQAAVIVHDADFLVENEDEIKTIGGHSIGAAIARVAKHEPHRLLIILELSDRAANRMLNDAEHRKWLDKLSFFEFDFERLDIKNLTQLLIDYLEDEGFHLAPAAINKTQQLIKNIINNESDNFKNAHAMRQLSESLIHHFAREEGDDKVLTDAFVSAYAADR